MIQPKHRTKPRSGTRINRRHPLTRGLVGLWLFNEGGKSIINLVGGSPGTITGGSWSTAARGVALDLNGSSDFATGTLSSSVNDGLLSFEAWCVLDAVGSYPMIVTNNAGGLSELRCFSNTGRPEFTNGALSATSATALTLGSLTHLVGTYDASSNLLLYVNGKQEASAGATAAGSAFTDVQIGRRYNDSTFSWDGRVLLVAVWNRVLSAGEVFARSLDPYALVQPIIVSRSRQIIAAAPAGDDTLRMLMGIGL